MSACNVEPRFDPRVGKIPWRRKWQPTPVLLPGNSKELDMTERLHFHKIPWRKKWQPTPVFLPRKSHGQRNLVGYSPWGQKESDTTKWLSTPTHRVNVHLVPPKLFAPTEPQGTLGPPVQPSGRTAVPLSLLIQNWSAARLRFDWGIWQERSKLHLCVA